MIKTTRDIKIAFQEYFKKHEHTIFPHSAIISPETDTTMFTIAGMKQFADVFLGFRKLSNDKVATVQPCLRVGGHNCDLENVGRTTRHMTFFNMLGNFSFGGYFREKAIFYAYDFLTNILKLDKKYLYITIYHTDYESYEEWQKYFDKDRIFKINTDDNFWSSGPFGPCGPCTEIYYDIEEKLDNVNLDTFLNSDGRFLEIWNVVLMQYNKTNDGLIELKVKNIDTGMGLERIASVVNRTFDVFKIDSLDLIVQFCLKNSLNLIDAKIISDHMRAAIALMYEGLIPGSEDRSYVLRKLLRRSKMKYNSNLSEIAEFIINHHEIIYGYTHNILEKKQFILDSIDEEENQTDLIIKQGMHHLKKYETLNEETAVNLNTTYGIPLEIINEYCEQNGDKLDQNKIQDYLKIHCIASKKKIDIQFHTDTIFTGYDKLTEISKVLELITTNNEVTNSVSKYSDLNTDFFFITEKSCLYAKGGGQEGDHGLFKGKNFNGKIIDTFRCKSNTGYAIIHHARLDHGEISKGDTIHLDVDENLRKERSRAHTATHILFDYLHDKYGCEQVGSFVDSDKARLDVTIDHPLKDQIPNIENYVNKVINEAIDLDIFETKFENIKNKVFIGANNKYGEVVRVVKVGHYSQELCGGTHVKNSKDIKKFIINRESSIKKGIRRLEFSTYNCEKISNEIISNKTLDKLHHHYDNKIINQYQMEKIYILVGENCSKNFILLRIDEHKINNDIILAFYSEKESTKLTIVSQKFNLSDITKELINKFHLKGGGDKNKLFLTMERDNSKKIIDYFKNIKI